MTHLYEFAHAFDRRKIEDAIFLRAERQVDSARTFKLIESEPLRTSHPIPIASATSNASST